MSDVITTYFPIHEYLPYRIYNVVQCNILALIVIFHIHVHQFSKNYIISTNFITVVIHYKTQVIPMFYIRKIYSWIFFKIKY